MSVQEEELKADCSNYDEKKFKSPSVTVDIGICRIDEGKLKVLLIKRKKEPYKGKWAFAGGFLELGHDDIPEDPTLKFAALRELSEETGVKNIDVHQLGSYGDVGRDPRKRVVTVAYFAAVPNKKISKEKIKAADDADDVMWADMDHLPKLAFDHAKIMKDLRVRLQGRIQYTNLAFTFLPKKFTWSELQEVYEIILGRELITPNFRRKIKSIYDIEESESMAMSSGGRPAKLISYIGMKEVF